MATQDYDIIKDIPGYKMILKAVLKHQIQQLVEQLASNTEEESVILTASVADGTLSHLGSQYGKGFLEDHEDIKSQFLGFCLKSHHKRKQEEDQKKAAEALKQNMQPLPNIYGGPPEPYFPPMPSFPSPRGPRSFVRPVSMHKATTIRSPGVRFEPYRLTRPSKTPGGSNRGLDSNPSPVKGDNLYEGQIIKIESSEDDVLNQNESGTLDNEVTDSSISTPSENNSQTGATDIKPASESSDPTITNDQTSEGHTGNSDSTNTVSGSYQTASADNSDNEDSDYIKMEAISESELELEITGVEPGRPTVPQESLDTSVSMGMTFNPTQGASGSQADHLPQVYNLNESHDLTRLLPFDQGEPENWSQSGKLSSKQALQQKFSNYLTLSNIDGLSAYMCSVDGCRKIFRCSWSMMRHVRTHTKEQPFCCRFCDFRSSRKDNLKVHEYKHVKQTENSEEVMGASLIDDTGMG